MRGSGDGEATSGSGAWKRASPAPCTRLLHLQLPEAAPPDRFGDAMLVMCHMLSPQLDAFLQGLRDGGVPRVALKAILTPFNVGWNSAQLRDELARERDTFRESGKR